MKKLFHPRTVAVVGASHHWRKVGHVVFYNLLSSFKGRVYPVNIKGGTILGHRAYKSLRELPERPDLVIIVVPSEAVPSVLREAVEVGASATVIISGGFGEVGRKDLDEAVIHSVQGTNLPMVGPNCVGIYTPWMNATFLSPDHMDFPPEGSVSVLSQSGAIIAAMLDIFARERVGVSKVVSLGNKLLLDEVDYLDYLEKDPETDVIVLYLEGVKRGRELFERIRSISKRKPVIILKGGKTKRGGKAASSHTEAIVGDYSVFRGAMRQAGAIEVNNLKELTNTILGLKQPIPKGRNLLILTNGGGFGVIASDYASAYGFNLPEWKGKLNLPPHIVQSNPFDLTGDATPEWYAEVIDHIPPDYDLLLAIITPQIATMDPSIGRVLKRSPIPVYAFVPGWKYADYIVENLVKNDIPTYRSIEESISVMDKLADYGRRRLL